MNSFLIAFGAAFLFSGGAHALGGLLYYFFEGISRWRHNRYAEKMGYPTLLDVAKRMDSRIKSKMPPFLGGGS